ncbi:uncharacterized protein LOC121383780 [Gigantopelta aegis]|uniref:uncharacterized protein LOC121383780 n=1 Tax=Gigantopelta aegis TaxID=1735272 RepID=UPI001B88DF4A|nr:uncharacterized protein LOC121383780 [Gigantopelta aegis]
MSIRQPLENHDQTNIAVGKKAFQSSSLGLAESALDGNLSTDFLQGTCSHTAFYDDGIPWWSVDLGDVYNITEIRLTNRGDCCGSRLQNFFIFLGNDSNADTSLCVYYGGTVPDGATISITCTRTSVSRFIKIQLNSNQALTLCEVQVFVDSEANNVALGKSASQSSMLGAAGLAVNNSTDTAYTHGSCSHTDVNSREPPWWTVDLGHLYRISLIKITNIGDYRGQALKDFDVLLTDYANTTTSLCMHYYGLISEGATVNVVCNQSNEGRYVTIRLTNNDMLSLCEVQVYGTQVDLPKIILRMKPIGNSTERNETAPDITSVPSYNSTVVANESSMCMCPCYTWVREQPSAIELQRILDMIRNLLLVRRNETSKFRRNRVSATDERVSARRIGFLGIFVFSAIVFLIVLSDFISLFQTFCPTSEKRER